MGTGAFKESRGDSAARYVAEEASNASQEALTDAFTELSDSERLRVLEALHTANMSKATTSGTEAVEKAPTPATETASPDEENEERKVEKTKFMESLDKEKKAFLEEADEVPCQI